MQICFYGASSDRIAPAFLSAAETFGRELAQRGHTLLFGGGARGLMGAVARGCASAGGRIIGVAPRFFDQEGVLYPGCTEMIFTDTMRQRKQILEDRSDACAAAPGGIGTFDELFEILTLKQLGRHGKPILLLNFEDYYAPLLALLENAIRQGFMTEQCRGLWAAFSQPGAALDWLEAGGGREAPDCKRI